MTNPPHMNNTNGGKPPMDQRRMAGYGSGISGVSQKPAHTSLGQSVEATPSIPQEMRKTPSLNPLPPSMNIGNMPSQPRFSNAFGTTHDGPSMNAPNYNSMPQAPMAIAPMGTAAGNLKNKAYSGLKKAKPLLIFSTIAGVTYLGLRTLSGRRSASRDDPEDDTYIDGGDYR